MVKWVLIALLAVISLTYASDYEALKLRKFIENNHQSAKSLSEEFRALQSHVDKFDNSRFRLPNNTRPSHYDLHLSTEIHSGNFEFSGRVRINVTVLETSNTITLHSRSQTIEQVELFNADETSFPSALSFELDTEREFLIITSASSLQQGQELILVINFRADLEEFGNRGFIRLSTTNPTTNEVTWFATTHFHPINSRHGYPCFDEVRFRASYQLSIYHHGSYQAISNTPVATREVNSEGFATTVFQPLAAVPSYVISYTVSQLPSINTTDNGLLFQVLARPEAIAAGQLDNALEIGVQMLRAMENLFNISYPLPSSTLLAAPFFGGDGAHNWGLITFREHILIQIDDDPIAQHWREIRLGHEYSHIFFGNLVSPDWWTFVWLNEGLATFYENVLNDILFPEKNQWERFLIEFFDVSISNDIYDFVDPMSRYVETQAEIRSRFNFITYQKAALVLRMFQQGLTDATWTKGLAYYLEARSMNSASPENLFVALREAVDEDLPNNTIPDIGTLMRTWLDFAGFPVVTVTRNGSNIVVTQEGFRTSHQEIFGIPLTFTTANNSNFVSTVADFWMTTREMTIEPTQRNTWTNDDWIIFNIRDTGYYVTNYDEDLWTLIIDALNNDHEAIHFLNRGTLYADLHRFIAENYDIRASLFLDMMQSLPLETNAHVWTRAQPGLLKFEERLRGSRLHRMHLNFVREIMSQVYATVEFNDITATNIVNRWSCLSGVESCRIDSLNALIEVFETGSTSFAADFRCNGFLTANETVWRHFFNLALTQDVATRSSNLVDLLCTTDRELLRFFLDQTIDLSNNLETSERESILHSAATQSDASYEVLIEFIEENHAVIERDIGPLENLLLSLCAITNTECQAERVLYLVRFLPASSNPGRNFFRTAMISNLNFYDANFDQFHDWFDNFESSRNSG